ncbi:TD and POZ domain-containing protein 2 [Nephila pilipes]|uniref:TD and POZ domain-containing protein 2 n=1 Tax=Nephila pilipes TaxID=299642 RepID=A0A8X6IQM4_NEPPI|nr:TD and POZ domain-containing protein 2 [Nephila pilipes]
MSNKTGNKCFCVTWRIENFSFCLKASDVRIESSSFIVETMEETKWSLWIAPGGESLSDDIGIYLRRQKDCEGPTTIEIEYEFFFIDENESAFSFTGPVKASFEKGKGWGFEDFLKREELFHSKRTSYLPKDTLTVCCKMWESSGIMKQDGRCFARSRIVIERKSFVWTLDEFSSLRTDAPKTYEIKSSSKNETVVRLNLIVGDEIMFLELSACLPMVLRFRLFILNVTGNAEQVTEKEYKFGDTEMRKFISFPLTKNEFVASQDFYLPNDAMTLKCECAFWSGVLTSEMESVAYDCHATHEDSPPAAKEELSNTLKDDLKSLLNGQLFCDTQLKTSTRTFPAHVSILSARSPVFKAMFTSDMRERANECVSIEDMDEDTVQRMLLYMYTDKLEGLQWKSACEVYAAADKYGILSLRNECSSFLKANLCPSNACEALILADTHSDGVLKTIVQRFILKHHKHIFNSDAWKGLMEIHPKLAADTMILKCQ